MDKFILIDGNSLIHRSFHALPPLKTSKGVLVNAAYGFFSILLNILKSEDPQYLVVTFDKKGPSFRHKLFTEYKATRQKAPQELYDQFPIVKTILEGLDIPFLEIDNYEADDLIASLARKFGEKGNTEVVIVSSDRDLLQIVDDHIVVATPDKGYTGSIRFNRAKIAEKMGLTPEQIVDYKALRGDPSDNIPGVKGIGDKTAVQLLKDFGSLDKVYESIPKIDRASVRDKLREHEKEAFLSRELATLIYDLPIECSKEACSLKDLGRDQFQKMFEEFEFYRLIRRLDDLFDNKQKTEKSNKTEDNKSTQQQLF